MKLELSDARMQSATPRYCEPPSSPGELFRMAMLEASRQPSLKEAALTLARHGIPCFPCNPSTGDWSKTPLTMESYGFSPDYKFNDATRKREPIPNTGGFRKATTDVQRIAGAWTERPDALVGLPVAFPLTVLDIDVHKAEENGLDSLQKLQEVHGKLPKTFTTRTAGGGLHLWFLLPEGMELPQGAGWFPGIDTRTSGKGYTVEFGTLEDGRSYGIHDDAPVATIPSWLVQEILDAQRKKKSGPQTPQPSGRATLSSLPPSSPAMFRQGERLFRIDAGEYEAAFRNECEILSHTTSDRNNQLVKTAFNVGQLVAEGGVDEEQAVEVLKGIAADIGLTSAEIPKTIRSGIESGKATPRVRTPRASLPNAYEALNGLEQYTPGGGIYAGTPPPEEWCIEPLFELGDVGVAAGPGGAGKSTMFTQAVFAVGIGEPWLGTWNTGEPRKAWYLSAEDSQRTLHRRQAAIMDSLPPRHQKLAQENVRLVSLKGMASLFKLDRQGVVVPDIGWKPFTDAVRRERPSLVVIDPFTALTLVDEINNTAITQCVRMVEGLAQETNTSIIYLHHVAKRPAIFASRDDMANFMNAAAVRGGGAIVNAPRWCALLYPISAKFADLCVENDGKPFETDGELVVFKEVKKNGGRLQTPKYFRHTLNRGLLVPCRNVKEEGEFMEEKRQKRTMQKNEELEHLAERLAQEAVRREQTPGEKRMTPSQAATHLNVGGSSALSAQMVAKAEDLGFIHVVRMQTLKINGMAKEGQGGGSRVVPSLASMEKYGRPDPDSSTGFLNVDPAFVQYLGTLAVSHEPPSPFDADGLAEDAEEAPAEEA